MADVEARMVEPESTKSVAPSIMSTTSSVRPALPINPHIFGPLFDPEEPLIERLAEAAAPKKEQPIAGWYGIQHAREPDVDVPQECMQYEVDRMNFVLGKVPQYRDYPQQIPEDAWKDPNEEPSYVFTPLWTVPPKESKADAREEVVRLPTTYTNTKLVTDKMKDLSMYADEVNDVRNLAADQAQIHESLEAMKKSKDLDNKSVSIASSKDGDNKSNASKDVDGKSNASKEHKSGSKDHKSPSKEKKAALTKLKSVSPRPKK